MDFNYNDIFATSSLINAVASLAFGLAVFFTNKKKAFGVIFLLFTLSLAIWSLSYYFWLTSDDLIRASFWVGMLNVASTFIPVFTYHWIAELYGIRQRLFLVVAYVATFSLAVFSFSSLYYTNLISIGGFHYWPQAGWLYIFYITILYVGLSTKVGYHLVQIMLRKTNNSPQDRKTARIILVAMFAGFVGGAFNFPLWYGIEILPLGNFLVFLYVLVLAYGVFRHQVIDAKGVLILLAVNFILLTSFVQLFFASSISDIIFRIFTFGTTILLSYFMVQSYKKEVDQKEKMELLADKLDRANKELKRLDNAKSEFISIASHQLRTPLTAIKGYISLIIEGSYGPLSQKIGDALDKIYLSNERLIQLVEDLLNISRIESGRMEYKFQKHDISETVKELEHTFVLRAKEERLDFSIAIPEQSVNVWADPSKIREVISNLIDNAIKYTEEGFIKVEVLQKNDKGIITIIDSGIGIPKEVMPQLFSKFSRGKDQSRLHVEGTGLGLYVGKNIVEAHKGKILVASAGAGKGSQFTIELPLAKEEL